MTHRITDITKGLLALAMITALLAGVPLLLWNLGSYPGSSLLDVFGDPLASDNTKSEQLLAGTLAIIAWFCWLQVAYALVIETFAATRGRVANRAALLPGIQSAAARLVTTVTLVLSSFGPTASAMAAPLVPMAVFEPVAISSGSASQAMANIVPTESRASGPTYTTSGRDTFWSIAESTLGDGLRWREVLDANVGTRMGDGTEISASTEHVSAGWQLRLPNDAVLPLSNDADMPHVSAEDDPAGEWVDVESGDHFWALAKESLADEWGRSPSDAEIAPYWAELVEQNEARLLPPGDANVIYPGQRFALPALPTDPSGPAEEQLLDHPAPVPEVEPAREVQVPQPESAPTTTTTTTTPTPSTEATPRTVPAMSAPVKVEPPTTQQSLSTDADSKSLAIAALGLGSLGVGAGALAVTLRRRRAHRAAKRKPGTTLVPPPEEANEYERRIRPVADTEAARWVEAANKLITARLAKFKSHRMPTVIAMRAGRFGVEVLLDEPCAPIEGFVPGNDENSAWRLHPDLELRMVEAETDGIQPYSPALVAVGSTEAGELLLDLEQIGVLSVEGEDEDVAGWFRSIAIGIATSEWSQLCEVVVLGDSVEARGFEQVLVPSDPEAWADQTVLAMRKLHERLPSTPYEQRVTPGEIFHPTIVLVGSGGAELAKKLSEAATLVNSPLAVVAACPLPVTDRVHLDLKKSTLEPVGVDFVPCVTSIAEAKAVADLLENASSADTVVIDEDAGEAPDCVNPDREPVDAVIQRIMAPRPIEVRLLCPKPAVDGLSTDPPAKQLSVICYLAYHRSVTSQRLRDTFWPTATSRKTADNAISQIRSTLGLKTDGDNRLTQATNSGEYEISDDIGCDWMRAHSMIDEASERPPGEAAQLLHEALRLVEGQVGADAPSRQFSWLIDDFEVYGRMESCLLDAAARLGELALSEGNFDQANDAAGAGLRLVPGSEAMRRIQMRVAAAMGDRDQLDAVYKATCRQIDRVGPWAELDTQTDALYSVLSSETDCRTVSTYD